MKKPFFILDMDAYVQTAHDLKESLEYADQAHTYIQDLFERSITSKLRERMNVCTSPGKTDTEKLVN
jgi:uncharacterized protein (TIGR04255 family)